MSAFRKMVEASWLYKVNDVDTMAITETSNMVGKRTVIWPCIAVSKHIIQSKIEFTKSWDKLRETLITEVKASLL